MPTQPLLLSKLEVTALVRVSDRSIERLVKTGRFPPPLRLGKATFWDEPVVTGWLNDKLTTQRTWQPKQRRRLAPTAAIPSDNQQTQAK